MLAEKASTSRFSDDRPKNWRCSEMCIQLTGEEIDKILKIKLAFEMTLELFYKKLTVAARVKGASH